MALIPERRLTTGRPSLHARCISACAPTPGESVIHIGAGAGYFSAIWAEVVAPGPVVAFERDEELAARAHRNLQPWSSVSLLHASATTETRLPPADIIYVCAGLQQLPHQWLGALRPGGRLVFPLVPQGELGGMLLVGATEESDEYAASFIMPAQFVPCVGAQDEPPMTAFGAPLRGEVKPSSVFLHLP